MGEGGWSDGWAQLPLNHLCRGGAMITWNAKYVFPQRDFSVAVKKSHTTPYCN